jgi:hypothetical protein
MGSQRSFSCALEQVAGRFDDFYLSSDMSACHIGVRFGAAALVALQV